MANKRVHLIAPAGSCRPFMSLLHVQSASELLAIVQEAVGDGYTVTGDEELIGAGEDEEHGGRTDDRRRAADIERALGDAEVAAVVTIRGGAWFTRVLPMIDFTVLDARTEPVAVFGFSELTTLVNIVAGHAKGVGIYDMGPAFLAYGLKRHAEVDLGMSDSGSPTPDEWMRARLSAEFRAFHGDVVSMIEGRGTDRAITAELIRGDLPDHSEVSFVGGNLTVLMTLVGSKHQRCIDPAGRWLLIEDLNEKPERIDRFLAQLTLAGFWDNCAGILLGDFHRCDRNLTDATSELLSYHLPSTRSIPVLKTGDVGHTWPMSPLPLNVPVKLGRLDGCRFEVVVEPSLWRGS